MEERIVLWERRRHAAFGEDKIIVTLVSPMRPLNPFLWRLSPGQLLQILPPVSARQPYPVPGELQRAFEAEVRPTLQALLSYPTPCQILAWNSYFYGSGIGTWKDHLEFYDTREGMTGTCGYRFHYRGGAYVPPPGDEGRTFAYFEPGGSTTRDNGGDFAKRFLKHVRGGALDVFVTLPELQLRLEVHLSDDQGACLS